jgi:hypothetical protein
MKWIQVHWLMSFLWFVVLLSSELRTREELVGMDMDMWICSSVEGGLGSADGRTIGRHRLTVNAVCVV